MSGGGGKGGSSSSTVSIPPEVLARYNAVNAQAEKLGGTDAAGNPNTPFKPYSTDPNAFVAPLTPTQQAGIANTNASAGAAQPWYQRAGGLAAASAQNVNPQQYSTGQIAQYMNPFAQQVIGGTLAPLQQQQAQDRQNLISSNIRGGAFGGDRAAIADAALRGQQEMATGNVVGGLLTPMYNQAQQEFNTQQGVNLAAQQANRQNYQTAAGLLGNLGTGAQTAALTGAQAQLSAGQQQQQTQQAGLTALYNQFLQQQSYPFQTTQFLANIAEGTGALSGSTTTGQQSGGFFSDERVKEDIEPIGETYDGQKIIKFRYKGDKGPKQIGLSAQDVEKHHPHAVGLWNGIKTVNYDEATKDSAHRGHFYAGGLASMGGAALDTGYRENFDVGGSTDQSALLQQLMGRQPINPYGSMAGQQSAVPTSRNIMTGGMGSPRGLMTANLPQRQPSGLAQASSVVKDLGGIGSRGTKGANGQYSGGSGILGGYQGVKDWMSDDTKKTDQPTTAPTTANTAATTDNTGKSYAEAGSGQAMSLDDMRKFEVANRGGRMGYDDGGGIDDNQPDQPDIPKPTDQFKPEADDPLAHQNKGLTIPDDNPHAQLATAQLPSGGKGGGSGMGGKLGSTIGGLAGSAFGPLGSTLGSGIGGIFGGLFSAGGLAGREHHAKGDTVGDDTPTVQAYNVPADPVAALHDINDQNNLPSGFMPRLAQIESRMGQNVYNPKSGASGWFQHIPSTAKARGIDPLDFQQSSADAAKMASENRSYLRQNAGIEDPTGAHLYLAHQQGPAGAAALLSNGDKSAIDALAPIYAKRIGDPDRARSVATAAVLNNGGTQDMSASDFAARVMGMYSGAKVPTGLGISGGKKQLAPLDEGALGYIQKLPGIGSLAKSEDQGGLSEQTKLALLGGLGGMLASPNRTFLGALGSGISSGVETYQGMGGLGVQQKQAETQAQLGKANIDRINFGIRTGAIRKIGDMYFASTADGRTMPLGEWLDANSKGYLPLPNEEGEGKPYAQTGKPEAQPAAEAKPSMIGETGFKSAESDVQLRNTAGWEAQKNASNETENRINQADIRARQLNNQMLYQAKMISSMPEGSILSGGPFNNLKAGVIGKFNDVIRSAGGADGTIGGRPISDFLIAPEEIDNGIIVSKMQGAMALNATAGAGQHANRTFEDMLKYLPSNQIPRSAALNIIAGNIISNRPDIDAKNYLDDYKAHIAKTHPGQRDAYLAQNAYRAFGNDFDQTQYLRDVDNLAKYLHYNKSGKPVFLMDPKEIPPEFWASTGIDPKTHKYIRGN